MKRLLCLFAGLVLVGLAPRGVLAADTIKIGLMAPLTGAFASEGKDMRSVIDLLAEEINAQGGINGKKVEVIVEDDGSDPRTAANAANRLVSKGIKLVIGTYGSAVTEATQDIYDEAGAVQVATGSTSVRLTSKGLKNFLRTAPRDDEQARVAVDTLRKLGFKKIAILHDNSAYAKGLADESKELIDKDKQFSLIFFDALKPGERDYTAIITKLKGVNPDVIFFTGYYPEAGMLLRQMREAKWNVPMMGGDAANNVDLVKIAGVDAAAGYRFISPPMPGDLDTPLAKNFMKGFVAKYNAPPSSIWSVAGGDAFNVLVEAVKHVGDDPKAVSEYLHTKLKNYDGLTGKISFDAKGDRVGDLYRMYEVDKAGKFILK